MILTGLTFTQLATLFACAGLGVVALYLLKLRRRTVTVPFSALWDRILRDRDATSLFSKLKRILSLLLQLALLGLLVLALRLPARMRFLRDPARVMTRASPRSSS